MSGFFCLPRANNPLSTGRTWPWKGGVAAGTFTPDYRALFPIPEAELLANPALRQNAGY